MTAKKLLEQVRSIVKHQLSIVALACVLWPISTWQVYAQEVPEAQLEDGFRTSVAPFLNVYCCGCHGAEEPEAKLDLAQYSSLAEVRRDHGHWEIVLERLELDDMPPRDVKPRPDETERKAVIEWIQAFRESEAHRNAGDPGPVFARRLSNAEYNYTIRDLTGIDIQPTKTFPVDPANAAGFDNSGESLAMSPALLNKYLGAARQVVEHLVLKPNGIAFAPHPVMADTDRDKYCVRRIVNFYSRQPTDYADYFLAAWRYRHRAALGMSDGMLDDIAEAGGVSPKYLATMWDVLNDGQTAAGPIAKLRGMWDALPSDASEHDRARGGCEAMRDFVMTLRQKLRPKFPNLNIPGSNRGSQTFVLWKNRQYVAQRRNFDPGVFRVRDESLVVSDEDPMDEDLLYPADEHERAEHEQAVARFASVFPDAFYLSERSRDYVTEKEMQFEKGRLLSAGFHSMTGYFRDDRPLYDLILDEASQREIDALWQQLNFVTNAPQRQYSGFLWFERTDSTYLRDERFDFARAENPAAFSDEMVKGLHEMYAAKARTVNAGEREMDAINVYFKEINEQIRWVEQVRIKAEPTHLDAVIAFAERAYRRRLTPIEREETLAFYHSRRDEGVGHEEGIRDTVVSVLMSPFFCYRLDIAGAGSGRRPLTDEELASRLSYFLWASMPDESLLAIARAGRLHESDVLLSEVQRMLRDDRVRGMAEEFGGNWLDFRRFQEHNAVDRERFPQFTDELREAMFEEPIRFFIDLAQNDRSVLDFIDAGHTFVNATLAEHYGMPPVDGWSRIDNASDYHRGGLLPMSVFLTKNAPGLRTSPVKRGYWVARRILGERIPPPPPGVPELPNDEAKLDLPLRDALAVHRDNINCASCHERFDSLGVAFENFGPVGKLREEDMAGRLVSTTDTFPGGYKGSGVHDLRKYLQTQRRDEYLDNVCRKLLSYALGRTLILPDELLIREMRQNLEAGEHRFGSLIETIVTSPQFLNKRGRDHLVQNDPSL